MLHCIDIMKAIACLLIANFHSDILFPENLSLLAFGGDVGNNIFFFVSGFVLYEGIVKLKWTDFWRWLGRRYLRILPMVLVTEILSVIVLGSNIGSIKLFVETFIFPTIFWFTGAIIVFYPILFIVEKLKNNYVKVIIIIVLLGLHIIYDSLFAERYFVGFIAMIMGSTMKKYITCHEDRIRNKYKGIYVALLMCTGIIYVLLKLLRNKGIEIGGLIHLGIGLTTIVLAIFLLLFLYASEEFLKKVIENNRILKWSIGTLSSITLAVYLVQGFADRILVKQFLYIQFPVSYMLELVAVLSIAYIVTKIDAYFHRMVKGKS